MRHCPAAKLKLDNPGHPAVAMTAGPVPPSIPPYTYMLRIFSGGPMIALRWFSIAVLLALLAGCGSSAGIPSTPDGTVQKVTSDLANDRPQVVWQALPASYQSDIREVIVAFADKLDADLWNRTFAVLGKITRVAKE